MDADTPKLVVTPEDKVRAEPFMARMEGWYWGAISFEHLLLEAFARHRIASEQAAARRALEMAAAKVRELLVHGESEGDEGWDAACRTAESRILTLKQAILAIHPSEGTEP